MALSASLAVQAQGLPGAAVFVRLTSNADDARSDVYEQSLAGGEAKVLVDHAALPKAFRGRIERALPSADGALLLLEESDSYTIRNEKTGATRLVLGSGYSTINDEVLTEQFKGGYWLWTRQTGAVAKIPLTAADEYADLLSWSPRGRLLLAHISGKHENLRLFDAATGKTRSLRATRELTFATWTPDASGILVGEQPNEKTTRFVFMPLNGKAQLLFTRPGRVFMGALSPDGRQVAFGSKDGFYLFSRDGRTKTTLAVPAIEGFPGGNMAFSPDGGTLAVFTSSTGSGPYANVNEALWTVETKTAVAKCVAEWEVTLGNDPGVDTTHNLLGWAPGQTSLLMTGRSCTIEGPDTEWGKLWLQPIDPKQPASLLLDTGQRGIDMAAYGSADL